MKRKGGGKRSRGPERGGHGMRPYGESGGAGTAIATAEPESASAVTATRVTGGRDAASAETQPGGRTSQPVRFPQLAEGLDLAESGRAMHAWMTGVFPLCRSLTGAGLRETLESLQDLIPLDLHEVPSGEQAFDWTVPPEWEIREAWIKDPSGAKVVDFRDHNLHVVNYSAPVRAKMPLEQLRARLHSLPEHPAWIPYRTSYYKEDWGFCLADRTLRDLPEGEYEVCIDSEFHPHGSMTYGEYVLPGRTSDQILIWAHACHPSLANDNLSGMAAAAFLARRLTRLADEGIRLRHTYRFVFAPATIGAIAWLARNQSLAPRIKHGLVLALVGDAGPFTYKRSRRGDAAVDRAVERCLRERDAASAEPGAGGHTVQDFSPFGYDERQFCSPGFDLPMGCLMRTPHGRFPQYHTSADDLDFVKPESLADTLKLALETLTVLECDGVFANLNPHGEPQLGRHGLYQAVGNRPDPGEAIMAMLWTLNLCDGSRSLSDVADRSGLAFPAAARAASTLLQHGLLEERKDRAAIKKGSP